VPTFPPPLASLVGSWFRAPDVSSMWHLPGLANSLSPIFPRTGETFEPTFSLLLFKRLNVNILIEDGQDDP
jgi:hypothetical protein